MRTSYVTSNRTTIAISSNQLQDTQAHNNRPRCSSSSIIKNLHFFSTFPTADVSHETENSIIHTPTNASKSVTQAPIDMQLHSSFENGVSFGKDPHVSRVLKGIFRERPKIPKRLVNYDTNIVIRYIGNLPCNNKLLLEELTLKLTTFLCILSGQRSQSIGALFPKHMHKSETTFTFYIPKIIKTTTPRFHQEPLEFEAFPQERKLCVHTWLSDYLLRTEGIRENFGMENTTLILSYQYPHHPVKSATLARYVKNFLGQAGIDLTVFTAHSTRSASSSKANNLGLSLKDISKAAGWKGHSTFQQFYKFPIQKNFGTELVKAAYMA